jgi:ABC-type nickel/cobalt efflux system permease component RcnA
VNIAVAISVMATPVTIAVFARFMTMPAAMTFLAILPAVAIIPVVLVVAVAIALRYRDSRGERERDDYYRTRTEPELRGHGFLL